MPRMTLTGRRRADRLRQEAARKKRKSDIEKGVATPHLRDICAAAAEAMQVNLAERRIAARAPDFIPTSPLVVVIGCLVRDGFGREVSEARVKEWANEKKEGPHPKHFAGRMTREEVWAKWDEKVRREVDKAVTRLEALPGCRPQR